MPRHPFEAPAGRLETIRVESDTLRANVLGDPAERTVQVYLPAGYDEGDEEYPLFVELAAFTVSGLLRTAWQPFAESVPQRIDRLLAEGRIGPIVVAFPDCFTSLGGNQYVDSTALGPWETFVAHDLVATIEARYRVRRDAAGRAVFGKSSGGYGALIQGLRHPGRWGAVACHSGDIGFEMGYLREMPRLVAALAPHDGDPARFLDHLRGTDRIAGDDFYAMMLLAMAASYDPDPAAPYGVRLPVETRGCRVLPERWARWMEHDPLALVERPEAVAALRSLRALYLDCGARDQYFAHFGARRLSDRLTELAVEHRYDEFDGTHSGIDHRLDESLPFLWRAVSRP